MSKYFEIGEPVVVGFVAGSGYIDEIRTGLRRHLLATAGREVPPLAEPHALASLVEHHGIQGAASIGTYASSVLGFTPKGRVRLACGLLFEPRLDSYYLANCGRARHHVVLDKMRGGVWGRYHVPSHSVKTSAPILADMLEQAGDHVAATQLREHASLAKTSLIPDRPGWWWTATERLGPDELRGTWRPVFVIRKGDELTPAGHIWLGKPPSLEDLGPWGGICHPPSLPTAPSL